MRLTLMTNLQDQSADRNCFALQELIVKIQKIKRTRVLKLLVQQEAYPSVLQYYNISDASSKEFSINKPKAKQKASQAKLTEKRNC